ncbi:unnamed protein product [Lymnaea stagnalis]|uniref:Uncharacterized protein n=1 Tax=Lymnaea stagnalis TaxID=6523 RepID=A0AAV2I6J0_LYMST
MERRRHPHIQCRPNPAPMLRSCSSSTLERAMGSPSRNSLQKNVPCDEFVVYRREPYPDDCEPQYTVYQREDDWKPCRSPYPRRTPEICPPPCENLPNFACPGCQCVMVSQKKNQMFDDLRNNNFFACVGNILTFMVAFFFFLSVLEYIVYHEMGDHPEPGPENRGRSFHKDQPSPERKGKEEVQSEFVPERDRKIQVKPETKTKPKVESRSKA